MAYAFDAVRISHRASAEVKAVIAETRKVIEASHRILEESRRQWPSAPYQVEPPSDSN